MGDVTMNPNGLLVKINSLFNNPLYSDVQFTFINENGTFETIHCHKLILALQSKAFAHLFFGKETSPSEIKMQASKKQLFFLLFKFLYTNDIEFHTFSEAQDLYELANDYFVEELVKRCHNYMLRGGLTIHNIFLRYDHALKTFNQMLLKDCRNFVCSNAQIVLQSEEFNNASREVVEDVVKLDGLPLPSELEIIEAVLRWGSESIKRDDIPYNEMNLRKSIDSFLKHLRILSLTSSEFHHLVEQYNIFNAVESVILIQKIVTPNSDLKLPENFCCTTSKRSITILSRKTSLEHQQYVSEKISSPKSVRSDPPKSSKIGNNTIEYDVRKHSSENVNNLPSKFKQKFLSSPNIIDIPFPTPNFSQNPRDFLFNLFESEKSFRLSFRKDIKCWVNIKMKSGNLSLYGFELKVKNKNQKKENLEVFVYLQGFSRKFEKPCKAELNNNVLSIIFREPMKLQEGSRGKLEVCIENLLLDRCFQIDKKSYEFNSGLNLECDICIDSNVKADDDEHFLFLFNKLMYLSF